MGEQEKPIITYEEVGNDIFMVHTYKGSVIKNKIDKTRRLASLNNSIVDVQSQIEELNNL